VAPIRDALLIRILEKKPRRGFWNDFLGTTPDCKKLKEPSKLQQEKFTHQCQVHWVEEKVQGRESSLRPNTSLGNNNPSIDWERLN